MARPSAASSRIDPRLTPEKSRPTNCARASHASTTLRLSCASRRTSASDSPLSASGISSVFVFGWLDEARRWIAARRAALSPALRSIAAEISVSVDLICASVSAASAFFTSGCIDSSAPAASSFTAAARCARSGDKSLSDASARSTSCLRRLLATTSWRSEGSGATAAPVTASTAVSPLTINMREPASCRSPSASARSTIGARSSPEAASAVTAAAFSSLSPVASFDTTPASSAAAGNAAAARQAKIIATKARGIVEFKLSFSKRQRRLRAAVLPQTCGKLLRLLGGHFGLVLLLVIAGDERAPRLRLHRSRRLPHDVELPVGLHLADEHRLVQVVVLRIHRGGDARRRGEGLAGHRRDHLVGVEALRLLDRLLPHVDADVCGFHRVVGERLVGARELLRLGVRGPLLLEALLGRRLDRHEIVPRPEVADPGLGVD